MSQTVVEKIAQAMQDNLKEQMSTKGDGTPSLGAKWSIIARAALEAMLEITPAQTAAIGAAAAKVNPHRSEDHIKSVALDGLTMYRAAIQAALNEGQGATHPKH